ncbi:MAG: CDP-glycerol glycerophosphotransferase family protein [Cellulosilyticaceae bacterium]
MKIVKHTVDLCKVVLALGIGKLLKRYKPNRDIWLISEREMEAEDNGYHLYRYIREHHPEQKVFYIINKKSKAYKRIEKYKLIINQNSFKHYIYYFMAEKHISAFQFFGVPDTPWIWKLEEKNIIKNKKIFIQHGITKEFLPFLTYKQTKYNLFACGAKPEYDYIKSCYGYPEGGVAYLGFCRFDNLHDYKEKRQILIMPTWRQWLGMTNKENKIEQDCKRFTQSEYFKAYQSLLNNERLNKLLEAYEYNLLFYPHPEMQRFLSEFKVVSPYMKICNRGDCILQEVLKESNIVITDYSSIAFDCGYMRKPVIYYQFDQEKYYKHHFEKGYFDCKTDGFGPVLKNETKLIDELKEYMRRENNKAIYIEKGEKFFPIYDKNNCKRTYEAIKKIEQGGNEIEKDFNSY